MFHACENPILEVVELGAPPAEKRPFGRRGGHHLVAAASRESRRRLARAVDSLRAALGREAILRGHDLLLKVHRKLEFGFTIGDCGLCSQAINAHSFMDSSAQIAILDYGSGNLRSVGKALEACGAAVRFVASREALGSPDAMVVPGVGAFGDCMANLRASGLKEPLLEWLAAGRPYLGICLGYQLLFEGSEESPGVRGLGVLPGVVRRFPPHAGKIPHMGWNQLEDVSGPLFTSATLRPWFYFVHSYYPELAEPTVASSWCEYGVRFAASVSRGALHATQFHPEKSQRAGLSLLQDFLATLPLRASLSAP